MKGQSAGKNEILKSKSDRTERYSGALFFLWLWKVFASMQVQELEN